MASDPQLLATAQRTLDIEIQAVQRLRARLDASFASACRLMLDCRGMQIGGGTIEIMVHIAGRGLLKEYAKNGFYY